jgi:hypothetical protein
MAREIRSQQDVAAAPPGTISVSDFKDRLVKLIPSEIVTAYVTIYGLITGIEGLGGSRSILLWIVFAFLVVVTPFYLRIVSGVQKKLQILFTTCAFIIWVMVVGSPINLLFGLPTSFIGSILMILYTTFIPAFYKG